MTAGQQLLKQLWTDEWIETFQTKHQIAYKILGDHQVSLSNAGQPLYLPSRIRRCIAERVGRVIRSQGDRKNCF